jgi:hypothetical protein
VTPLGRRIARLEQRHPTPDLVWGPAEPMRQSFWKRVTACEACITEDERHLPEPQKQNLVYYVAWLRRFQGEADLEKVFATYGWTGVPTDALGWMLACSFVPGDF